ncbi:MAG: hypothetical protein QXE79_04370 [Candidatus Bathyarchaeia archaeon]
MEKPFWLNPPYIILFDLLHLNKLKPWSIKLANILDSFLREIRKKGYVDFSASGTALLSSSMIHRMKSELLLKMEEPPMYKGKTIEEFVPPPLPISFRFEYTLTSISDILDALISALEKEHRLMEESRETRVLEVLQVPTGQPDDFLTHIEEYLDKLYIELIRRFSLTGKPVSFSELTSLKKRMETVRIFILLIFLAHEGRVYVAVVDDDLLITPLQEDIGNG